MIGKILATAYWEEYEQSELQVGEPERFVPHIVGQGVCRETQPQESFIN